MQQKLIFKYEVTHLKPVITLISKPAKDTSISVSVCLCLTISLSSLSLSLSHTHTCTHTHETTDQQSLLMTINAKFFNKILVAQSSKILYPAVIL